MKYKKTDLVQTDQLFQFCNRPGAVVDFLAHCFCFQRLRLVSRDHFHCLIHRRHLHFYILNRHFQIYHYFGYLLGYQWALGYLLGYQSDRRRYRRLFRNVFDDDFDFCDDFSSFGEFREAKRVKISKNAQSLTIAIPILKFAI